MSQSSSSSSSAASSIQLAAVAVACTAAGIAGGLYYGHKYVCSRPQGPLKKRGDSPLWEYSVIYTDRAYNLMSTPFQAAMRDISASLKKVYNADSLAIIPGSGTYAMESVARQFGTGKRCLVIRNGYFSYRWSDIFEVTKILPQTETVCYARPVAGQEKDARPQFAPCPLTEVVAEIKRSKPAVVFAPHVETSLGILLPDTYIAAVADAVHSYGGVFVLDAIAAGNVWCDMKKTGVDVLISAPQKGWTGPSCAGLVLLSARAAKIAKNAEGSAEWEPESQSFCCNLRQWLDVVEKYEDGGFKYYTTLPTDALMTFRNVIKETEAFGIAKSKAEMVRLGQSVRDVLKARGFKSVAADGFAAPGVVVVYDSEKRESKGTSMIARFKSAGIQIAGGVPFKLGEEKFGLDSKACTFRIGLFGLDKMMNVDECVKRFEAALDKAIKKE